MYAIVCAALIGQVSMDMGTELRPGPPDPRNFRPARPRLGGRHRSLYSPLGADPTVGTHQGQNRGLMELRSRTWSEPK